MVSISKSQINCDIQYISVVYCLFTVILLAFRVYERAITINVEVCAVITNINQSFVC